MWNDACFILIFERQDLEHANVTRHIKFNRKRQLQSSAISWQNSAPAQRPPGVEPEST
jgi:hypothetical protein